MTNQQSLLVRSFVVLVIALTLCCETSREREQEIEDASEITMAYAIELGEEGGTRKVGEDFRFRSGDRFRLLFRPGFSAYLYIFNQGRGEERYTVLFPNPHDELINPIRANSEVAIPGQEDVWMRLDEQSGDEELIVVASTIALPSLEFRADEVDGEEFEKNLAQVERQFKPESSRRLEDENWVKLFAGGSQKEMAVVVRLFLRHEK